jgi:hypothetical protein
MAIAKGMQDLTQDIQDSSRDRAADLTKIKQEAGNLRQTAAGMVKDFNSARGEDSQRLKQELSRNKTERIKKSGTMTREFHDARRKSGEHIHQELVKGNKLRVQNEKNRKQEVGKMLDGFQNSQKEAGAELKKELTEGKARMEAEIKETLAGARKMIGGYNSARQAVGTELKSSLKKNRGARQAAVKTMRNDLGKTRAAVQSDLKEAADAWKEMGSAMSGRNTAVKTKHETQAEMPPEITQNLEEKCLSIINQHPDGITLSDIAKELGVVTIVLGKAAKVLVEQGKVRREDKVYFPAAN